MRTTIMSRSFALNYADDLIRYSEHFLREVVDHEGGDIRRVKREIKLEGLYEMVCVWYIDDEDE